jgi:antitoxin CptB
VGQDIEHRRKRAQFRACHRGTKEMDWLVGRYAEATLASMDEAEMTLFERLLTVPDPDLQSWIMEPAQVEAAEFRPIIDRMRAFHGL